jgi:hypothetical protein
MKVLTLPASGGGQMKEVASFHGNPPVFVCAQIFPLSNGSASAVQQF